MNLLRNRSVYMTYSEFFLKYSCLTHSQCAKKKRNIKRMLSLISSTSIGCWLISYLINCFTCSFSVPKEPVKCLKLLLEIYRLINIIFTHITIMTTSLLLYLFKNTIAYCKFILSPLVQMIIRLSCLESDISLYLSYLVLC